MDDHDDWLNTIVRRAAQEAVGGRQFKGTLSVTAYNKKTHAVKGIILPHGIESGWVPVAAIHAGNGFGILVGPKVGDAKKLDGDQMDIEFDLGDPNTIVARHRQFSTPDKPPEVESGEILIQHENKAKIFFDKAGNLTAVLDNKAMMKLKVSGDAVLMPKDTTKIVFLGGDPDQEGVYAYVETVSGPSINVKARIS